jgi:ribosome modulation factor
VRDVLKDALARGYDAGLSLEPHMVVVFHDTQSKASNEEAMRKNYVEYGRRLEKIVGELKQELKAATKAPVPEK